MASSSRTVPPAFLWLIFSTWSLLMLAIAIRTGIQHDYGHYLEQWNTLLTGSNPWGLNYDFPPNTYGPLHNVLALAALAHFLVPKVMMLLVFVIVNALIVQYLIRQSISRRLWVAYAVLVPFNFVTISVVAVHGDNDALVASLVGLALISHLHGRLALAGIFIGLGALLKFYPLLLVPFFALSRNSISWQLVRGTLLTLAIGVGAAFLVWDTQIITPLSFGASRPPTFLSPLTGLQNLDIDWLTALVDFLLITNSAFVLMSMAIGLAITIYFRLSWVEASVIGLFFILVTYKVGHVQFYLAWLILLTALLPGGPTSRKLLAVFAPFIVYLQLIQLLYYLESNAFLSTRLTDGHIPGLTTLFTGILTIGLLVMWLRRHPGIPTTGLASDGIRLG